MEMKITLTQLANRETLSAINASALWMVKQIMETVAILKIKRTVQSPEK